MRTDAERIALLEAELAELRRIATSAQGERDAADRALAKLTADVDAARLRYLTSDASDAPPGAHPIVSIVLALMRERDDLRRRVYL